MGHMFDDAVVTIGMPVRNGGEQVRVAIESLLAQTHKHIRIVISDNCSTDDTFRIISEYAAKDSRVEVFRQPVNVGHFGNFRFVLMKTESPFYMWACHDDVWAPDFVAKNLASLAANPSAVASISQVTMMMEDGTRFPSTGTYALTGPAPERVKRFLWDPGEASRFYAVFHAEILKRCVPADIDVFGHDWIILALNLIEGEHLELPEVLLVREGHPENHYYEGIVRREPIRIYRWMPLLPMTRMLKVKLPPEIWKVARWGVIRRNIIQVLLYAKYRVPALKLAVKFLYGIDRRARAAGISQKKQAF
jgi:glycosyltransferase involved in cell wall biosynthesis